VSCGHHRPVEAGPWLDGLPTITGEVRERVGRQAAIEIAVRVMPGETAAARGAAGCPVAVLHVTAAAQELQVAGAAVGLLVDGRATQVAKDLALLPDRRERLLQDAATPQFRRAGH
jgi:hypothetical protein